MKVFTELGSATLRYGSPFIHWFVICGLCLELFWALEREQGTKSWGRQAVNILKVSSATKKQEVGPKGGVVGVSL